MKKQKARHLMSYHLDSLDDKERNRRITETGKRIPPKVINRIRDAIESGEIQSCIDSPIATEVFNPDNPQPGLYRVPIKELYSNDVYNRANDIRWDKVEKGIMTLGGYSHQEAFGTKAFFDNTRKHIELVIGNHRSLMALCCNNDDFLVDVFVVPHTTEDDAEMLMIEAESHHQEASITSPQKSEERFRSEFIRGAEEATNLVRFLAAYNIEVGDTNPSAKWKLDKVSYVKEDINKNKWKSVRRTITDNDDTIVKAKDIPVGNERILGKSLNAITTGVAEGLTTGAIEEDDATILQGLVRASNQFLYHFGYEVEAMDKKHGFDTYAGMFKYALGQKGIESTSITHQPYTQSEIIQQSKETKTGSNYFPTQILQIYNEFGLESKRLGFGCGTGNRDFAIPESSPYFEHFKNGVVDWFQPMIKALNADCEKVKTKKSKG